MVAFVFMLIGFVILNVMMLPVTRRRLGVRREDSGSSLVEVIAWFERVKRKEWIDLAGAASFAVGTLLSGQLFLRVAGVIVLLAGIASLLHSMKMLDKARALHNGNI